MTKKYQSADYQAANYDQGWYEDDKDLTPTLVPENDSPMNRTLMESKRVFWEDQARRDRQRRIIHRYHMGLLMFTLGMPFVMGWLVKANGYADGWAVLAGFASFFATMFIYGAFRPRSSWEK